MTKLLSSLCLALALLLLAGRAQAIALPPGATDVVPNTLSGGGGTGIMAQELPFAVGGLAFAVSQRLRTESITPSAPPRQYELGVDIANRPGSAGAITSLTISGLANALDLDVSYNNFAFGNRNPSTASRSADGDRVTFTFSGSDELDPGDSTRDLRLRFDAAVAPKVVGVVRSVNGIAVPVDVVFDQPGQVPGGVTPAWLSATIGGDDGYVTYDRFVVASDAPIGRVRWEGFYAPGASLPPNTTSWEVEILSGEFAPDSTLAAWTLPADEVSETFIGTASFGGTVDVYRFDATLPTSFAPTPGTPYWLMVRSFAPTTSPGFHWSVGLGDDDESVQDEIAVQRFFRDGDRAFTLFVPEPAGSLGAGVAAAVLAALARRRATR